MLPSVQIKNVTNQVDVIVKSTVLITVMIPDCDVPFRTASGFILAAEDQEYLITAGHTIAEINEDLSKKQDRRPFVRLIAAPTGEINDEPRVAQYVDVHMSGLPRADLRKWAQRIASNEVIAARFSDFDLGIILLSDYVKKHLASMGIVPLSRQNAHIDLSEIETRTKERNLAVLGVGFPQDGFVKSDKTGTLGFHTCHLRLDVVSVEQRPRIELAPAWESTQFNGDVIGMSGCPIAIVGMDKPMVFGVLCSRFGRAHEIPERIFAVEFSFLVSCINELFSKSEYWELLAEIGDANLS